MTGHGRDGMRLNERPETDDSDLPIACAFHPETEGVRHADSSCKVTSKAMARAAKASAKRRKSGLSDRITVRMPDRLDATATSQSGNVVRELCAVQLNGCARLWSDGLYGV